MLKNAYFLEKDVKKSPQRRRAPFPNPCWPPAVGGSAPRLPRCYTRLLLQLCQVHF